MQRRSAVLLATSLVASSVAVATIGGTAPAHAQTPRTVSCVKTYVVVAGDYWYAIARRFSVSLTSLLDVNEASTTTALLPGNTICLPEFATTPTTPPAATVPAATTPAMTAPATTVPAANGPVLPLGAFPVQGPCSFGDTYGATRSGGRQHEGVDMMAKTGLLVYAVAAGTLTKQTTDRAGSLSGNAWWLTGTDRTYYFYAHLAAFAPGLKVGSKVVAGQFIGYVGATGNAGGSHLHFEIHPAGGKSINPTASVKAVDGCKNKDPLPQPDGSVPPALAQVQGTAATTTSGAATPAPAQPAPAPAKLTSPAGGGWQFIPPANAFDSARNGQKLAPRVTRTVRVDNLSAVDKATSGVMVRLTASGASARGFVVIHRCDLPMPLAASLSYQGGGTAVGTSIVGVTAGTICATSNTPVSLRIEVIAFRSSSGVGLQPISSIRALDTRTTTRLVRGTQMKIDLPALGHVPGTQALSTTITIVNPAAAGTFSIGFCGQGLWNVPISADALWSFAMTMRVSNAGWCLTSSVSTDVVVDVTGLWVGDGALAPVEVTRVYDSRNVGITVGPAPVAIQIAGQGSVPGGSSRAMLSISNVAGALPGIVFAVPCGDGRSVGVVSAGTPNRITTAVVPVRLGNGAICVSAIEPVDLIIDVVAAG
jgi:murein DD-endopeptidase MepM/ murein hydrolase activator NlpD